MSNKRKLRKEPTSQNLRYPPPPHVSESGPLAESGLQEYVDERKPDHPDYHTMYAAMRYADEQIQSRQIDVDDLIKQFCDPQSLIYLATERAFQDTHAVSEVKDRAAMFLSGFVTACMCQDRAIIDMNEADYQEYERNDVQRQEKFESFRRQSSDVFCFQVDRETDDDKTFSKGSLEWLHDLLWLFIAARIAAHWDRNGTPCRSLTVNVQVDTDTD